MAWMKRIFLFIAVNMLVMLTISLILGLLNVGPYLNAYGMDYSNLAIFCLVWGMGGAFVSLALSRLMAKWMMGVQLIDPETRDPAEMELLQKVYNLARSAGLPKMPEVGVYDSPELNAFATGPTRSRALVAVSTGLLQRMNSNEVEGVLAHEVSHVANGDMVTMTLVQGVVNAFVMFAARVLAFLIAQASRSNDREEGGGIGAMGQFAIQFVLEIIFMFFGAMVVAAFSRWREFRADAGAAKLSGAQNMIAALQALKRNFEIVDPETSPASIQTMKISGHPSGLMRLFASHPSLDERIERLSRFA